MHKLLIAILEAKKIITADEAEKLAEQLDFTVVPSKYEHAKQMILGILK